MTRNQSFGIDQGMKLEKEMHEHIFNSILNFRTPIDDAISEEDAIDKENIKEEDDFSDSGSELNK